MIEVNTHKYYQLVAIAIVSYLKILSCGLHQTHKKLSKYMKFYYGILGIVATVAVVAVAGYWYVFIAGAPQLDPPNVSTAGTNMTFQLKTFDSKAMGTVRQYGLILPPGYDHSDQRYSIIFLLHGGHDDARAWVDKIGIIPVLHDLYKSGKLPPSIVITPDGNDKRGSSPLFDPDYYDGPNGKVAL